MFCIGANSGFRRRATAPVSGFQGSTMSRNEGALKALLEWTVAHLYSDQPEAEASDRALRALCGQLGRNPPYVEAAPQITDDGSATVVAGAISPSGKVAVVLRQNASEPLSQRLRLVTYTDGGIKDESIGTFPENPTAPSVTVQFPQGSEEPAIVSNHHHLILIWGFTMTLPENAYSIRLWRKGEESHVAYIVDNTVYHKIMVDRTLMEGHWNLLPDVYWIDLVGGSLACLTSKHDDTDCVLHWRDWQVRIDTRYINFESIAPWPESPDKLILIGTEILSQAPCVYIVGAEGIVAQHRCPTPNIYFDNGEVFNMEWTAFGWQLHRFTPKGFETVGEPTPFLGTLARRDTQAYAFGSTVVLANFETFAGASPSYNACIITPGHGSSAPNARNDLALTRLHHGIAVRRRNGTFHWNIPTAADDGTPYADFPLYGLPFSRLTATQDKRGLAVMSWGYTDGTLHVLRYPLPSR